MPLHPKKPDRALQIIIILALVSLRKNQERLSMCSTHKNLAPGRAPPPQEALPDHPHYLCAQAEGSTPRLVSRYM